ncbi:hypothetical protein FB565_008596 [Actinoplanes lutulentus]|uniref:Uncharacterized protein n=1 Tax=Actinoplanes lutulentus TaxID=1287878 RepID=A0A327Z364_9ACTN|nr:hypothetical protein [Actinoplanes lutulentus]MBB2948810.1 hypothetical protein [Actinoplanes lutulentus]RAK29722.1 hypothetical protein B0I29_11748 [Actinoplanes lutulentus]
MTAREAGDGTYSGLCAYLGVDEPVLRRHERAYAESLRRLVEKNGITVSGPTTRDVLDAVSVFQRGIGELRTDGIACADTLWELHLGAADDRDLVPIVRSEVDVRVSPSGSHGHDALWLRADAAHAFRALRDEMVSAGAIVTTAGGVRRPDAPVTSGRSAASMHYAGLAFDLWIADGMRDPHTDPYLVTEQPGEWRVWARTARGRPRTLDAVVHEGAATTSVRVTARVVDFTAAAAGHGFAPIGPRPGFPADYLCAEWWHFQYHRSLHFGVSQFGIEMLRTGRFDMDTLRARDQLWAHRKLIYGRRGGWS